MTPTKKRSGADVAIVFGAPAKGPGHDADEASEGDEGEIDEAFRDAAAEALGVEASDARVDALYEAIRACGG